MTCSSTYGKEHSRSIVQLVSEKKHKASADVDQERETGQVQGMAITKRAVEGEWDKLVSLE